MGKEIQKVNAERKRQRYSKEFKLAAVKLLQSGANRIHQSLDYRTPDEVERLYYGA
ncbi:MAG: hypothetical protein IPM27_00675 [Nitrosomonadales bacterium]|nr:hypothetical protein [Nitrosomonadales bacterium]